MSTLCRAPATSIPATGAALCLGGRVVTRRTRVQLRRVLPAGRAEQRGHRRARQCCKQRRVSPASIRQCRGVFVVQRLLTVRVTPSRRQRTACRNQGEGPKLVDSVGSRSQDQERRGGTQRLPETDVVPAVGLGVERSPYSAKLSSQLVAESTEGSKSACDKAVAGARELQSPGTML